jgi:hypothetical protein
MATDDQIRDWQRQGNAIHRVREDRKRLRGRSAEEIETLRSEAARFASVCADCFAPLAPMASITLVGRFIEHIPAHESPNTLRRFFPARDIHLTVPICLTCWLVALADPARRFLLRGWRQDGHLNRASPEQMEGWEVRRLRCGFCERPMRVDTERFRRLRLRDRYCCLDCLRKAKNKQANDRRRVRHDARPSVVCGRPFIPKQTTAKTCGNTCRQRLHRQRHAGR